MIITTIPNVGKAMERLDFSYIVGEKVNGKATLEKFGSFLKSEKHP